MRTDFEETPQGAGYSTRLRIKQPVNFYILLTIFAVAILFPACDEPYGKVGGADTTITYTDTVDIAGIIDPWCGVWYSHYGNRKLDSYRVGKWKDRAALLPGEKLGLISDFDINNPMFRGVPANIKDDDYFIFYDDTVFESAEGGETYDDWGFGYMGIVSAINVFQTADSGAGAVIIEYLDHCYPRWEPDLAGPPPLPFFGIYYRILTRDTIQMANAVILANLYAGTKYYTETATLKEAIAKNNAENDGEFIAWGVVIPQDREK
jgi:hypothetical protein